MKKLSILRGSMILALAVGGLAGCAQQAQMARADGDGTGLAELLNSYNDGGYTKKTTMYLTEDAQKETKYFHNGANQLQRATYYNADETALLMGNYDGTFAGVAGATGINAGYKNNDRGGVDRFVYEDTDATVANMFDAGHHQKSWSSATQTVGGYYQTLKSLATLVNSNKNKWVKSGDAYIHDVDFAGLDLTDGEYNDTILKQFQYFAAPMMLQNKYFSWHTIRVVEGASFLSIRLYASSSDSGKSTMVGTDEALISEARIYKGVNLSPEVSWVLESSVAANDGVELNYSADLYIPEQYSITRNFALGEQIKLSDGNSASKGFNNLENTTYFKTPSNDKIQVRAAGEYTIYFKPTETSAKQIYIAVPEKTLYFSDNAGFGSANCYAWGEDGLGNGGWPGVAMTYVETNQFGENVYKVNLFIGLTFAIFNGGGKQTVDIDISDINSNEQFYTTGQSGGKYTVDHVLYGS